MTLQIERLETLDGVRAFVEGSEPVDFKLVDRESAYGFVRRTLVRFRYHAQGKSAKGLLRAFLGKATGLSRSQLARLIRQHRDTGAVADRRGPPARPFQRRYTQADIRLLAKVDGLLGQASGPSTRKSLRRMFWFNIRQRRAFKVNSDAPSSAPMAPSTSSVMKLTTPCSSKIPANSAAVSSKGWCMPPISMTLRIGCEPSVCHDKTDVTLSSRDEKSYTKATLSATWTAITGPAARGLACFTNAPFVG